MESNDVRILRGAAVPAGLAGVVAVLISLLVAGPKGALGAVLGLVVVIAFFSISMLAVSYAGKVSPQMMMQAALFSYLVKFVAVLGLVVALKNVTFMNPKAFAWTVITLTLVWVVAEARASFKIKILYVDPDNMPVSAVKGPLDRST